MAARPFDATIEKMRELMADARALPLDAAACAAVAAWPQVDDHSLILRSDMAFELGGGTRPALGCTVITGDASLVPEDALRLIGPDLPELAAGVAGGAGSGARAVTTGTARADVPFARVTLVRVAEDVPSEGQALYRAIRDLEHVRYHFYPRGFMLRVSTSKHRESVRVGSAALAEGLAFGITGAQMIQAFHSNPQVEAVSLTYITDPDFDYAQLASLAREAEKITGAIDHMMKIAMTDCSACGLKPVCDEVEGLRELHFHENG